MKTIRALACMWLAALIPATARGLCNFNDIYLFTDLESETCVHFVSPGEPFTLYVVASFDWPADAISEASIRIPDWIADPDPSQGSIQANWTASSVDGDLASGLHLVWDDPLLPWGDGSSGRFFVLGTLDIVSYSDGWLTEPRTVQFDWSYAWDDWQVEYDLFPWMFGFNVEEDWCHPHSYDPPFQVILAQHFLPREGELVLPDFELSFEVYCEACYGGYPGQYEEFTGSVSVDGVPQHEFNGTTYRAFALPIALPDLEPGSEVTVRIDIDGGYETQSYELTYIVDDTAVAGSSLSTVKSVYRN